jgi:hypothetical protein
VSDAEQDTERIERPRLVLALIILASLLAVLSALNSWVERQLLDTDEWVKASSDLLADDDVRSALSAYLVDELYESVDVQAELEERLPEDAEFAAGPLSAALRRPATDAVDNLLETDAAKRVWSEANRSAHETLVSILEDDTPENLSTAEGKVVLNLGGLVTSVGEDIGIPTDVLSELEEDVGTVTIVESEELETAQNAVQIVKLLSALFFIIVVGLYGLAVYLAGSGRRLAVRNIGIALILSGLVLLVLRRLGVSTAVDGLVDDPSREAAGLAVGRIATDLLESIAWAGVTVGVLIAVFAMLAGPADWAVKARRTVAPYFRDYPLGTWVVIAAVVMVLVAWSPFSPFRDLLTGVVSVVLLVVGIEAIRRLAVAELGEEPSEAPPELTAPAPSDDDESG